ncbi:DUF3817 domain-containing protein [Pseudoclavibacter endophyticus]|uniref:DUF3817 domain-containing protein n=1 Tax=Pseudoclavibacter endophyticus TaxID=1778590 RepID=A0A6H9WS84_9MICO|nr:DUF3817 domain-containing protein [Pseudoclavibacter endophyticus]
MDRPRPESFPRINLALRCYQITSYITGVLLLLLVVEMIFKYGFHLEFDAFGAFGVLALVPEGTTSGVNLSLWVLIVHGWFYVVYLIACFVLWQLMRWPLLWLLAMAAGGVVPFMSFITEMFMARKVRTELRGYQRHDAERERERAELSDFEATLSDEERARIDAEVERELAERRTGTPTADASEGRP